MGQEYRAVHSRVFSKQTFEIIVVYDRTIQNVVGNWVGTTLMLTSSKSLVTSD